MVESRDVRKYKGISLSNEMLELGEEDQELKKDKNLRVEIFAEPATQGRR